MSFNFLVSLLTSVCTRKKKYYHQERKHLNNVSLLCLFQDFSLSFAPKSSLFSIDICGWIWPFFRTSWCWVFKKIFFARYVKKLSIQVHCMCLAESINKWVKGIAVRGTLSPLSGLICEFVNLIGQEILHISEKSPEKLWLWQPWLGRHLSSLIMQEVGPSGTRWISISLHYCQSEAFCR